MSTKVPEDCPACGQSTMPETHYPFVDHYQIAYQQWRYYCRGCGNIWANEAQRAHNSTMANRAIRDRKGIYG